MQSVSPPLNATAIEEGFVRDLRLLFEAAPDVLLVLLPDAPSSPWLLQRKRKPNT